MEPTTSGGDERSGARGLQEKKGASPLSDLLDSDSCLEQGVGLDGLTGPLSNSTLL